MFSGLNNPVQKVPGQSAIGLFNALIHPHRLAFPVIVFGKFRHYKLPEKIGVANHDQFRWILEIRRRCS